MWPLSQFPWMNTRISKNTNAIVVKAPCLSCKNAVMGCHISVFRIFSFFVMIHTVSDNCFVNVKKKVFHKCHFVLHFSATISKTGSLTYNWHFQEKRQSSDVLHSLSSDLQMTGERKAPLYYRCCPAPGNRRLSQALSPSADWNDQIPHQLSKDCTTSQNNDEILSSTSAQSRVKCSYFILIWCFG